MVEVVAAMAVLAVLLTVAAGGIVRSFGVTGSDRQRVRAASVATQEVERVRGLMQTNPAAITAIAQPSGLQADGIHTVTNLTTTAFTVTSTPAVGGAVFDVVDSGAWQSPSSYNALNMTVTITWPNMQGIKPVVNSAVLTAQGANGDGKGGQIVTVASAPPSAVMPVATLSPTCSDRVTAAAITVSSTVSTPTGLASIAWDGTTAGTVIASSTGSNPCVNATVPLSYSNGAFHRLVALRELGHHGPAHRRLTDERERRRERGGYHRDPARGGGQLRRHPVGQLPGADAELTLGLADQPGLGATVTGTRATNATCSIPVTTTFSTSGVTGLLNGPIAYGSWTFTSPTSAGTATATATVASGLSSVTLTASDTSCPNITAPLSLAVKQSATVYGVTSTANVPSGTITAARAANGACGATTATFTVSGGSLTGSPTLPYGVWTLSLNGSSAFSSWPAVTWPARPRWLRPRPPLPRAPPR